MVVRARAYLSEFIGAYALLLVGVGVIVTNAIAGKAGVGPVGIAFAHGLVIAAVASAVGPISGGHFNPAVTISALIGKRIGILDAIAYIVVQALGAWLAVWTVVQTMDMNSILAVNYGTPAINDIGDEQRALILEALFTFFLCFVVYGTAFFRRAPKVGALYVGFAIAMAGLAIGPLTGASINPVRFFGPAMFSGGLTSTNLLVYVVGPIIGGLLAGVVFGYFLEREPELLEGTGGPEPGSAVP